MAVHFENREFYHINCETPRSPYPLLQKGDELIIGKDINPWFRFFKIFHDNYKFIDEKGAEKPFQAIKHIEYILHPYRKREFLPPPPLSNNFNVPNDFFKFYFFLAREYLYEYTRQKVSIHNPSRTKCLWLTLTPQGARKWLEYMNIKRSYQILRVKATGRAHFANAALIPNPDDELNNLSEKAKEYWTSSPDYNNPNLEIIFEGSLNVVEILERKCFSTKPLSYQA